MLNLLNMYTKHSNYHTLGFGTTLAKYYCADLLLDFFAKNRFVLDINSALNPIEYPLRIYLQRIITT